MKSFLFLAATLCASTSFAQTLSQQVVGSAGNEMLTASLDFSYTIGEPCVSYWLSQSPVVTEGFQQNQMLITAVNEASNENNISVYPNPFDNAFTVEVLDENCSLVVTDALGRIIITQQLVNRKSNITMQAASSGLYIVSVQHRGALLATYRLIKTN